VLDVLGTEAEGPELPLEVRARVRDHIPIDSTFTTSITLRHGSTTRTQERRWKVNDDALRHVERVYVRILRRVPVR
jgi:hypothetical protein